MRLTSDSSNVSLSEVHRSVAIPRNVGLIKRLFAFAGPAYLVSVGYMDPGNWATDLEGGARFVSAYLGIVDVEHNGGPATDTFRENGDCGREGPGPGMPRRLSEANRVCSLDTL